MAQLSDKVRMLFDGTNFAVLSTVEADGMPHSTVVWVKRDGDDLLFALPTSRLAADLNRDPRAAVVIFDAAHAFESAQVPGTASIDGGPGRHAGRSAVSSIHGWPVSGFAGPNPQWVIARITPDKVITSWPNS